LEDQLFWPSRSTANRFDLCNYWSWLLSRHLWLVDLWNKMNIYIRMDCIVMSRQRLAHSWRYGLARGEGESGLLIHAKSICRSRLWLNSYFARDVIINRSVFGWRGGLTWAKPITGHQLVKYCGLAVPTLKK